MGYFYYKIKEKILPLDLLILLNQGFLAPLDEIILLVLLV